MTSFGQKNMKYCLASSSGEHKALKKTIPFARENCCTKFLCVGKEIPIIFSPSLLRILITANLSNVLFLPGLYDFAFLFIVDHPISPGFLRIVLSFYDLQNSLSAGQFQPIWDQQFCSECLADAARKAHLWENTLHFLAHVFFSRIYLLDSAKGRSTAEAKHVEQCFQYKIDCRQAYTVIHEKTTQRVIRKT